MHTTQANRLPAGRAAHEPELLAKATKCPGKPGGKGFADGWTFAFSPPLVWLSLWQCPGTTLDCEVVTHSPAVGPRSQQQCHQDQTGGTLGDTGVKLRPQARKAGGEPRSYLPGGSVFTLYRATPSSAGVRGVVLGPRPALWSDWATGG